MSPARKLALAAALALIACRTSRHSPPVPSITPDAPPSASAPVAQSSHAPPDAGPASSPLCAPILAHNATLLAKADVSSPSAFADPCLPTLGGAWALRLDRWEKTGNWAGVDDYKGAWTLVHIDRAGTQVTVLPGGAGIHDLDGGVNYSSMEKPQLYDYDGDGEPEILVSVAHKEHEGAYTREAIVMTFKAGAVREMPGVPPRYEEFTDVDGDGRPDVLYFPYATDADGPCTGFGGHQPGPSFVAHSLPGGGFSLDDAVARAHVAAQCPKGGPPDGGPEPAHAELCARFRGATEAQAVAVLNKECKKPGPREDGCHPRPGVCFDYTERRDVLAKAPPFRLPR